MSAHGATIIIIIMIMIISISISISIILATRSESTCTLVLRLKVWYGVLVADLASGLSMSPGSPGQTIMEILKHPYHATS